MNANGSTASLAVPEVATERRTAILDGRSDALPTDEREPSVIGPDTARDDGRNVGRRVGLVTVGAVDRRAAMAVAFGEAIGPDTLVAIHVAVDPCAAQVLGTSWMCSSLGGMPLLIVDDLGGVAVTIRSVATELLCDGASEVTVVAGRLTMPGISRLLLHDHTADAIGRALASLPGARVVLVPVAIELAND